eukprot:gene9185-11259_t
MATIIDNRYGKAKVRVLKVNRNTTDHHSIFDFDCCCLLKGEQFKETYLTGDNSKVVATDSIKNTVYILSQKEKFDSLEEFGIILGKHFISTYSHVQEVHVTLKENVWARIQGSDGKPQAHSFVRQREVHTVSVVTQRNKPPVVTSGIDDLLIMKTTQSGFENFLRDQYTTLKETKDRIFCTVVTAQWTYNSTNNVNYSLALDVFRNAVFDIFSKTYSKSVQETLYIIAKTALEKFPQIEKVHLSLPNKHAFGFDFSRLNLENANNVFQPVEEPSGLIEGTISKNIELKEDDVKVISEVLMNVPTSVENCVLYIKWDPVGLNQRLGPDRLTIDGAKKEIGIHIINGYAKDLFSNNTAFLFFQWQDMNMCINRLVLNPNNNWFKRFQNNNNNNNNNNSNNNRIENNKDNNNKNNNNNERDRDCGTIF